jgi:hypothetical protein
MRLVVCLLSFSALVGCAGTTVNPVVADTKSAEAEDGYRAALATVHTQGYLIEANDPRQHHLRVLAKPVSEAPEHSSRFDIDAVPGAVLISWYLPHGRIQKDAEARALRRQMQALAWGIGGRAWILGGEPTFRRNTLP